MFSVSEQLQGAAELCIRIYQEWSIAMLAHRKERIKALRLLRYRMTVRSWACVGVRVRNR